MRLGWMALPLLIAVPACSPVQRYQEAARSLRFSLDRVEPRLELAFPLEQSRITLELTLGVENPSTIPFHVQGFTGAFRLETAGRSEPLGRLDLSRPVDLPAGGNAALTVVLSFTYQDLASRWPELQRAVQGGGAGAWELEGTLKAVVHGLPIQLPVKTRRTFGDLP